MNFIPRSYDFFGSVVLAKFPKESSLKDRKNFAEGIMKNNPGVKTVLEKTGKFKGRLRKQETKFILGEKTKEVLYRENGCVFRFNIDSTYFSPRLSNERKDVSNKVKKNDEVFVMFGGVAPYAIVMAKNSKAKKVFSVEINKEASKYAIQNVELNKLKNRVETVQGDVKKIAVKFAEQNQKFDVIVMPRPQLKESFLKEAFLLSKKGTKIFYYDFCKTEDKQKIVDMIHIEAEKYGKDVKILKTKEAGEIAPRKVRLRVDFEVL